ncbi:hypothetical protein ELI13_19835 [Rhizobium ruizarguesonis]|jgi:hypothetical protein|uniref:Uncharacterized protein n=1 Tax=Rhizobium ruizarguesonis TaxID=2081791 RepID=A0ABY1XE39_9HYPH|nr:hypothetical protein [Rhizobium ruizarguesonis]NKJ72311.1 hypothetical protein [Rhizobium leguminosarum bv. viciae]MBC2805835.1 hypothetical protein [Rhizobium ruizarguesonis]NEJ85338.1 hypothetical protein [Rhizobium ruizarguesonis]NKQ72782.1 hypothetical protein [Rhizobium ruizarguesonis]NKQ80938.1 hypothetical protein [Rhizobium ruizarguesonis]
MNDLASTNPFLHAIFSDHMNEAKEINATFQAGDEEAAMKATYAMIRKYGDPAFSSASDASAIEVLKKAGDVIDALGDHYPRGCIEFVHNDISSEALSILSVNEAYRKYQEAQRLAYEDGKFRKPIPRMEIGDMFQVVTEDLGVSRAEVHTLLNPENVRAIELCAIIRKDLNISAVREPLRGPYARANITSKK